MHKNLFTEFFYFNEDRKVIEFLSNDSVLLIEHFFKESIPKNFREFIEIVILNESEESVKTWFYDTENIDIIIKVNWGFEQQEISLELDVESFYVMVINNSKSFVKNIDIILLNDFIISFLTNQAKSLSQSFDLLVEKNTNRNLRIK